MNVQRFVTTEFGTRLWMALGRWLPPWAGYRLANLVADIMARRQNSALYGVLCANQAGVLGSDAGPERLQQAVRAVLRHVGMTAYDLMHVISEGEEAVRHGLDFGPDAWANIEAARVTGRGVMVCGCHLSNFNLGFLSFALSGSVPVQVLSSARPTGGFELMRDMRDRGWIEETPIDGPSLRKAIQRLRTRGMVATAADWPLAADPNELTPFFGRPAMLPTGHIRVAMAAGAVLLPFAARWHPDRGYYALSAPHLELELTGDRAADVRHNARRVLAVMEKWIAETPDQWLMYHRVWPADPNL
jgi:lauroyl/myristoyl acyltransferase